MPNGAPNFADLAKAIAVRLGMTVPQGEPVRAGLEDSVSVTTDVYDYLDNPLGDKESLRAAWLGDAKRPPTGVHTPYPGKQVPSIEEDSRYSRSANQHAKWRSLIEKMARDYPYAMSNVSKIVLGNARDGAYGHVSKSDPRVISIDSWQNPHPEVLLHELVHIGQNANFPSNWPPRVDERPAYGAMSNEVLAALGKDRYGQLLREMVVDSLGK